MSTTPQPPDGPSRPMRERLTALAGVAAELARASHELGQRIEASGREARRSRERLATDLRQWAEAESRCWQTATTAVAATADRAGLWLAHRAEQSRRLETEAVQTRQAVSAVAREEVADLTHLEEVWTGAAAAAAGRWEAQERQWQDTAGFLRLLGREQQGLQRQLATLSRSLAEQQESRRECLARAESRLARATETRGLQALARSDLPLAEALFERAWELAHHASARHNLIVVLLLSGQTGRATALLGTAEATGGDPVGRQVLLAFRAYRDADFVEARRQAEAGLAVEPGHVLLRQLAAAAAARSGAVADAWRLAGEVAPGPIGRGATGTGTAG